MITTAQEYFANLAVIQSANPPAFALLPTAENIYHIDINTREVEPPAFISLEKDHKSETIYFEIDRFVNYMDLATTCCVIQYNNTKGRSRYYAVPFYDIYTKAAEKKILFPWCIDSWATQTNGTIEFSIQFFKIGTKFNSDTNTMDNIISYSLNTLPAKTKILKGISLKQVESDDYYLTPTQAQELQSRIDDLAAYNKLYWTVLTDDETNVVDVTEITEELENIIQ